MHEVKKVVLAYSGGLDTSVILAPLIGDALRQSLLLSAGSFRYFVSRPISGTLMAVFALACYWSDRCCCEK